MNVQAKIKSKGFTIAQVAARIKNNRGGTGISQGALSTALNGNPSIDKLREIADIIGMPLSELVSDNDGSDFVAMIRFRGELYCANSIPEAESILTGLKTTDSVPD